MGQEFLLLGIGIGPKMSFAYHIDSSRRVVIARFRGVVTMDDLRGCFAEVRVDPGWRTTQYAFLDFTGAAEIVKEPSSVKDVTKGITALCEGYWHLKTAIVMIRGEDLDLLRSFRASTAEFPQGVEVFESPWVAWDWLSVPDPWIPLEEPHR